MKHIIKTEKAPSALGPYSQGIQIENVLITSGQLPVDPATGMIPVGIEAQTRLSLSNCKAVIEAAGMEMCDVVKTTVYLSDLNDFGGMNQVYSEFFKGSYPARSAVEVSRLLKGVLVEIECIAVK